MLNRESATMHHGIDLDNIGPGGLAGLNEREMSIYSAGYWSGVDKGNEDALKMIRKL